jgi:hypothetical protein
MLAASSCASVKVSEGSRKVRLVKTTPHNCKYVGEINADWSNAKEGGYFVATEGSKYEYTYADVKNQAAELGADTVELTSEVTTTARGEAYLCGDLSKK